MIHLGWSCSSWLFLQVPLLQQKVLRNDIMSELLESFIQTIRSETQINLGIKQVPESLNHSFKNTFTQKICSEAHSDSGTPLQHD